MEKYRVVFNDSIIVIVCITLINVVCGILQITLPDMLVRIFGILDLVSVAALIFAAIKMRAAK